MSSLKSLDQKIHMLISKADRPNVFISDILCVVVDLGNEGQLLQTIIHVKEDEKPNKCLMCNDKLKMMLVKGHHVSHDWCKQIGFEVDKDGKHSTGMIEIEDDCKSIYDDEHFSEEDNFELVQKKYIYALVNRGQVQHEDQRYEDKQRDCDIDKGESGNRKSLEVVLKMKEMYKDISKRQDQNCVLMENETMLSHENNQGGAHAHLDNKERLANSLINSFENLN